MTHGLVRLSQRFLKPGEACLIRAFEGKFLPVFKAFKKLPANFLSTILMAL